MEMKWIKKMVIVILSLLFLVPGISYAEPAQDGTTAGDTAASAGQASVDGSGASDGSGTSDSSGALDGLEPTPAGLVIDSQNRYEGMERTYAEGYIPKVERGRVYLVVPLLCSGRMKDNCLRASLNLGDSEQSPFVIKNYEKNIYLEQMYVNDGSGLAESYVAAFWLELKAERYNGSYPVVVTVQGEDENGNAAGQEFTVYVTIADGREKKDETDEEETHISPKVVIQSCQFSKLDIQAGDEVTAEITLVNTSAAEEVRGLVVTVGTEAEFLTLLEQSNTLYAESIPASGAFTASCRFRVNRAAPQGQYALELAMNYTDSKSNECSGEGKVMVSVAQPAQVQFDPVVIPQQVEVADTIEVSVQVMNLGRSKVYNVRAVLQADGLAPQGTLFVGDLEEGTVGNGSTQVSVGSRSGDSPYGKTEGIMTFYYEDEAGTQQTQVLPFETTIQSPFTGNEETKEEQTGQWWILMAVILVVLSAAAGVFILRTIRRRRSDAEVEEILET